MLHEPLHPAQVASYNAGKPLHEVMLKPKPQPPPPPRKSRLELHLCSVPGLFWCHYPAGGSRNLIEAVRLRDVGTRSGVPDLLFCLGGRCLALELKVEKTGQAVGCAD
jgi:hypothetical protein